MLLALAREEVRGEQGDVAVALAQRGESDLDAANAVVEILAKTSLLDGVFELAVRGGDDADVGGAVGGVADAAQFAVLQKAEELRLRRERELADFVEEERAAVGRLDETGAVTVGAGERAAHAAEELRLDERLRKRRAVDGGEGLGAPRRVAVDGARDELLAGAGLAEDADRDVAAGDAGDEREDVAHRRRVADDAVDGRFPFRLALFLLDDAAEAVVLGAEAEERGDGVARRGGPGVGSVDVEEFALAAAQPIGGLPVERGAVERIERADLAPVAEAVARGEAPAKGAEIVRGEGEVGGGGDGEDARVVAIVGRALGFAQDQRETEKLLRLGAGRRHRLRAAVAPRGEGAGEV